MGKILSLLIGVVVITLGVCLLVLWRNEVLFILKGVIPGVMILGGVIALLSGISEFKDTLKSKIK
ncbi:MAG: hypothetical protein ABH844_02495 [Candidatus Omnitrophota bacterium]